MPYPDPSDIWKNAAERARVVDPNGSIALGLLRELRGESKSKYAVGTRLESNEVQGTVVKNFKMPGDICVQWDNGQFSSYDPWWLDDHAKIMKK